MLNERNTLLEDDGIEEEILVEEECSVAQAVWGDIQGNIENQTDLQNALDAKQDSLTEAQLNAVNSGITAEKVTTYDGYADQIASKANQSALNAEATTREQADTALGRRIDDEATARQQADNGLQSQIDAVTSKSDVVDVVANYAALQAYDTSSLGNNDVIKVLDDETHEDALAYYRWSTTTQTWTYIGQEAPYYSKGQMDVMLQGKQDKLTAGANIQIQNGTISATDTTYTAGNGLNLNGTEFSADTTVLATKADLEGYYTKTETDTKLAPKLEAEVVAELPTTGEEGKLYLTPKAHTTQTATGNPITATITEQAGKIESFQLDGNTYQQSYTGKNLLGLGRASISQGLTISVDAENNNITVSGTATGSYPHLSDKSGLDIPAGTYTLSIKSAVAYSVSARLYRDDGTYPTGIGSFIPAGSTSCTFTTDFDCHRIGILLGGISSETVVPQTTISELMLETGQTATSFEPYVGGVPAPNPDYPQPIQTVTGLQTISINGTDYPLDLGDIELCGLGDDGAGGFLYKDRIFKDGEDWKVHKETGRLARTITGLSGIRGNASVGGSSTTTNGVFSISRATWGEDYETTLSNVLYSEDIGRFVGYQDVSGNVAANSMVDGSFHTRTGTNDRIYFRFASYAENKTVAEVQNAINADGGIKIVYYLATPTDTTITDTDLIAQLEAIRTASLQNGANTITNTATGSNLAGDMEIGYYGYNPRNRYDKWLWLDINNEYEQIGG